MLGDAAQPAESDGSRNRATSGPRHAAPRRSLLTKLHVPAGKAVALAAMPTAVLMGMGFTPHFAQADEMPKSPFKPGPCVSQPDTPSTSSTAKDSTAAKPKKTTGGSSGTSGGTTATPKPSTSPTPAPSASQKPDPVPTSQQKSTTTTAPAAPKPAPSPTKSSNPLDPLGLGNLLGGLLGGGSTPTSSPAPSPTTPAPSTTTAPATPKPSASPSASPSTGTGATDTVKKLLGGTTDTVKKATKGLTDTAKAPLSGSTAKAGTTPTDGSQGYPCPTYDAKALADATTEGGIPLLPDAPFTLKTTKLTLHGLNYDGIVKVRTYSGQVKDVLKFTASGIDIKDLWQIVDAPGGGHTWVKARAGSTSTFTGGTVTLYTESLSGNLLGLVPVTFTPKAPPPLTLPELFFTNATVVNAGQFGGNLHVPGMQVLPGQS
ncbi:hydrogenase expression protein HypF [Actinacidiphila acidipaludis]|uniref:Hydrogenase expression protein HypF n=1 Tax=Actinacidiphila acidipaludis TaxID=2873382 RepID=A0ABS7QEG5_9ACTN|nr:hydrogenase expression protein HypF [Streptomyces acidipaludis]MBY8881556.1 hydrogenase expression protein HypF [Streptomyces acidipaludis]